MAFTSITARGSNVSNTSNNSLAVSPSANLTVGKIVFVSCFSDNNNTTDGDSNFHSLSDTHSHVWTKIFEKTETDGAADDGVTVSLFATKITTQIGTGNSITLTLGANKTDKIISIFEATVPTGITFAVAGVGVGQGALSATVSGLLQREYLWIGVSGSEGEDNAKTPDADYGEQFDLLSSTSGALDVNIAAHVQTRIFSGTSDTVTSTDWTNTNVVTVLAAIYETDPIAFPSTSVLDSFTRADENPLAGGWDSTPFWFGSAVFGLTSNQAYIPSGTDGSQTWATSYSADQEGFITISATTNLTIAEVYARGINENTAGFTNGGYYMEARPAAGTWSLNSLGAGGTLRSGNRTISAGDSYGIRCVGSVISIWVKPSGGAWTILGVVTNTDYAAGGKLALGMSQSSAGGRIDDFGGGNYSASPPGTRRVFIT